MSNPIKEISHKHWYSEELKQTVRGVPAILLSDKKQYIETIIVLSGDNKRIITRIN